jgi:ribonucleoside-diphosphate reductase beta chain
MQGATWFPREINFSKDRNAFDSSLSPEFQEIYKANLLFQTMADSLANRFLDNVLSEQITSPEWESIIKWQAHQELVHSEAYSWNIREVFNDPEKFFNDGFKNKELQKRLELENDAYSNLEERFNKCETLDEKKLIILEVVVRQYVLESIRFFVSFLYTFKINEINSQTLQGSENNIILIANDEKIHVAIFKHLISILRANKSEEFSHLFGKDFDDMVRKCFNEVIDSEIIWFKYLSNIQEILGFTESNIREFLKYYSDNSMKNIGVDSGFGDVDSNELVEFFKTKTNIRNQKSLAQETDLLSYSVSVLQDGGFLEDNLDLDLKAVYG